MPEEVKANPEKVKEILTWLESKTGWVSGDPLSEYAKDAPKRVTKSDLYEAFLNLKPCGVAMASYDSRGDYITALAHCLLQEELSYGGQNILKRLKKVLQQFIGVKIELRHPDTGKYSWDRFGNIGYGWEYGTLVLKGNFGKHVAGCMCGGKVIVEGNVGPGAGSLMAGGKLEINGIASYDLGFGMTGGYIYAQKAAPGIGSHMHGGLIEIAEPINLALPGPNNVVGNNPEIGVGKSGGRIIIGGKKY